jgi:hypothetical protein
MTAALPYALAVFLSAFLLFWLEPMVAKLFLPTMGGVPAVWNTALVFYQAALFAGYVYAHLLTRGVPRAYQPPVHAAVVLVAVMSLPLALRAAPYEPGTSPVLWQLGALVRTAGLPFLALAATAPLLQRWYSHRETPDARDPYFLYAISNAGSLLALALFVFLIEPAIPFAMQSRLWSAGYALAVALVMLCAIALYRPSGDVPEAEPEDVVREGAPLRVSDRLWWVALSFVPSSLLLGVTTHINTDVASVPLLWVVPLGLYLATFMLAFARRVRVPLAAALAAQTVLVGVHAVLYYWGTEDLSEAITPWVTVSLHLLLFSASAIVCHGALAARRPSRAHLTEYYLWVSAGGIMGGAFNALAAPVIFSSVVEYPAAIVLALLLRPADGLPPGKRSIWLDLAIPAGLVLFLAVFGRGGAIGDLSMILARAASVAALAVVVMSRRRPLRMALCVAAMMVLGGYAAGKADVRSIVRTYFGVYRVIESPERGERLFFHGRTIHSAQSLDAERRGDPTMYFARSEPFGLFHARFRETGTMRRVGVVGLGAGTMAAYGEPGQEWVFFELDPAVAAIARDPRLFTYLPDSRAKVTVVIGDGRVSLAREPNSSLDMIVIDAFGSDAIPVHVVTREAIAMYMTKLRPGGYLVFHITNKYFALGPVLAATAKDLGLDYLHCAVKSEWVAMGSDLSALADLGPGVTCGKPRTQGAPVWTDDHSSVVGSLRWR